MASIFLIIFLLFHSTLISSDIRNQRDYPWNSSRLPPFPEPGDPGLSIDHLVDNYGDPIDFVPNSNHRKLTERLAAGHRCQLNKTKSQCKEGLICENQNLLFPINNNNDNYGICTMVNCGDDRHQINSTIHCPADSLEKKNNIQRNGKLCRLISCVCKTYYLNLPCQTNSERCPHGYQLLARANGMPGKCCDQIKCLSTIRRNCTDDTGVTYGPGQSWQTNDCHRCKCNDGVNECDSILNCPIGCLSNENVTLAHNECCLPCKGCTYKGTRYEHQQTWQDEDCRRCTCHNGKEICSIESNGPKFCDRPCNGNERRVWNKDKCCDKCECDCHHGLPCECIDNYDEYDENDEKLNSNHNYDLTPTSSSSSSSSSIPDSTTVNDDDGGLKNSRIDVIDKENNESKYTEIMTIGVPIFVIFALLVVLSFAIYYNCNNCKEKNSKNRYNTDDVDLKSNNTEETQRLATGGSGA